MPKEKDNFQEESIYVGPSYHSYPLITLKTKEVRVNKDTYECWATGNDSTLE
jgi:hypothetical protein